jgi:hypothetical protein
MYLTARKQFYAWGKSGTTAEANKNELQISSILDAAGMPNIKSEVVTVSFRAMYWRKANAIHKWFVDNVQNGTDDCGEYDVSIGELSKLLRVCRLTVQDRVNSHEHLPTTAGFFFGSSTYDSYYFSDIKQTIIALERLLSTPNISEFSFTYNSSW